MSPEPGVLEYVLARAANAGSFEQWRQQARATQWCSCPVRLAGITRTVNRETGEILRRFTTSEQPDGQLLKACGQRRATACRSCADIYRSDAWHLIAAGIRGGKGTPSDVADHPLVFVTLTAPSFGPVHSRREIDGVARLCSERAGLCVHGRSKACLATHTEHDDLVGQPLCEDCFDYEAVILWNALATELWRRTTIALMRTLASDLGLSEARLRKVLRVGYVRVVEYQRRGAVHFHAVVRIDGADGPTDVCPFEVSANTLRAALLAAAARASVCYPSTDGVHGHARWGRQVDVRTINADIAPERVAAYIAKYATKSTDPLGRLDHRLRERDLKALELPTHLGRLVWTAWSLGARPELNQLRLRAWAHTLGFRGHWLTKSRRYSTTFKSLRTARAQWTAQRHDDPLCDTPTINDKDWRFVGRGWANPGDELLAETARELHLEARRLAQEDRRSRETKGGGTGAEASTDA